MTAVSKRIPDHLLSTDDIPSKIETRQAANPNSAEMSCNGQGSLMIGTVVFTILSLIPGYRTFSSLALRSIAIVSTSLPLANWQNDGAMARASKVIKVGAVALGLTGIILKTPAYVIASLVADIVSHTLEIIKQPTNESEVSVTRILIILTNIVVISAIAMASWKLMFVASAINIIALSLVAWKAGTKNQMTSALCYGILAGLSFFLASSMFSISDRKWTIDYTNRTDQNQTVVGNRNIIVATLKPGETYTQNGTWFSSSAVWVHEISKSTGSIHCKWLANYASHTETNVPPFVYAQLPIGGTAIPETAGLTR